MNAQLLAALLGVIANAARTPGINAESVATWTELLGELVGTGSAADQELLALKAQVETMVAEKRDPTDAEWSDLRSRGDDAHDVIQNWRR